MPLLHIPGGGRIQGCPVGFEDNDHQRRRRLGVVARHLVTCSRCPIVAQQCSGGYQPSDAHNYKTIIVEKHGKDGCVGLITLNRPKAMNALNNELMLEVASAVHDFNEDKKVGAIVITGSPKVFAAGADIKMMSSAGSSVNTSTSLTDNHWECVSRSVKPTIAAVNGIALGGGCELAMQCDIILAGENARFGQPEVVIGTIPGGGGTQRLPRAIGKSRAMQMCLTGEKISAKKAEDWGLVSSVHPTEKLLEEAVNMGEKICVHSKVIVSMCKESINKSYELSLLEGCEFEKNQFYSTFATDDCIEGMMAFIEKRKPNYTDK